MTDMTWAMLRDLLVEHYDDFRRRLARRLGSAELATETLHEAWLQLARTGAPVEIRNPESYLFRVALNVAFDQRQASARELSGSEIEALRHIDDDELDPERVAEARSEMRALKQALSELSPRCRSIFIAARLEEVPQAEIARRLGVSTRMVERELKRAFDYFEQRLERTAVRRVGSRALEPSSLQGDAMEGSSPARDERGPEKT